MIRFFLILSIPFFLLSACNDNEKDLKTVAIFQIVEHPSLNTVRDAIKKTLKENETLNERYHVRIITKSANGNASVNAQIAHQYTNMNPTVIVSISTPSTLAMVTALRKKPQIPLVFAAITDPISSHIVSSLSRDRAENITGVTDKQPIEEQIGILLQFFPKIKSLGILYNAGEPNSNYTVNFIKEKFPFLNILEAAVPQSNDVIQYAHKLFGKVDALYIPQDNTIASAIDTLIHACLKHGVPLFSADPDLVKKGALASIGFSYQEVGVIAAKKVVAIIEGTPANHIDIESPYANQIFINRKTAEKLKIEIPPLLKKKTIFIDGEI